MLSPFNNISYKFCCNVARKQSVKKKQSLFFVDWKSNQRHWLICCVIILTFISHRDSAAGESSLTASRDRRQSDSRNRYERTSAAGAGAGRRGRYERKRYDPSGRVIKGRGFLVSCLQTSNLKTNYFNALCIIIFFVALATFIWYTCILNCATGACDKPIVIDKKTECKDKLGPHLLWR